MTTMLWTPFFSRKRSLWTMPVSTAVYIIVSVSVSVSVGVGVGVVDAQGSAPVSCDAKMGSLLASEDFVDFASAVKGANLEHIALVEALMEDPEVEVRTRFACSATLWPTQITAPACFPVFSFVVTHSFGCLSLVFVASCCHLLPRCLCLHFQPSRLLLGGGTTVARL